MNQKSMYILALLCYILVYSTLCFSSIQTNALTSYKSHLLESDSCLVTYKLQIIRDLDSTRGSKYDVEIGGFGIDSTEAIKFLWQNQVSSTFEVVCKGAKIHYINVILPAKRIITVVIDQRSLTAVNKQLDLTILIAERHFPKNEYSLVKITVNSKKRSVYRSTRYLSKKKFEKYGNID